MAASSCFPSLLLALSPAFALAGLTGCGGSTTSADLPTVANPLTAEESAVVYQLNVLRTKLGLPDVTDCYSMNISAAAHSDDLRDNAGTLPLGQPGSDGSTVQQRACTAGYKPACGSAVAMGEVVASGYDSGDATLMGWQTDPVAGPIIEHEGFVVVGVGASQGATQYYWTLDLAGEDDASCTGPD